MARADQRTFSHHSILKHRRAVRWRLSHERYTAVNTKPPPLMMLDGFNWPRADDSSDEKLISDVKTYGWHAVGVAEGDDAPPSVYSVGLYLSFGHPEIIVVGLPQNVGHKMIANAVSQLKTGRDIVWDVRNPDILEEYDVIFKVMDASNYRDYLGYALWFYRSLLPELFPTLQLVWPDKGGLFPWEVGYEPSLLSLQPVLSSDAG